MTDSTEALANELRAATDRRLTLTRIYERACARRDAALSSLRAAVVTEERMCLRMRGIELPCFVELSYRSGVYWARADMKVSVPDPWGAECAVWVTLAPLKKDGTPSSRVFTAPARHLKRAPRQPVPKETDT